MTHSNPDDPRTCDILNYLVCLVPVIVKSRDHDFVRAMATISKGVCEDIVDALVTTTIDDESVEGMKILLEVGVKVKNSHIARVISLHNRDMFDVIPTIVGMGMRMNVVAGTALAHFNAYVLSIALDNLHSLDASRLLHSLSSTKIEGADEKKLACARVLMTHGANPWIAIDRAQHMDSPYAVNYIAYHGRVPESIARIALLHCNSASVFMETHMTNVIVTASTHRRYEVLKRLLRIALSHHGKYDVMGHLNRILKQIVMSLVENQHTTEQTLKVIDFLMIVGADPHNRCTGDGLRGYQYVSYSPMDMALTGITHKIRGFDSRLSHRGLKDAAERMASFRNRFTLFDILKWRLKKL